MALLRQALPLAMGWRVLLDRTGLLVRVDGLSGERACVCEALIHPHESDVVGRIYKVIRCAVCAVCRWDVFVQYRQEHVCALSAKSSITTVPNFATILNVICCVSQDVCVDRIFLMNTCAGASSCRTCMVGSFPSSGQHILPTHSRCLAGACPTA